MKIKNTSDESITLRGVEFPAGKPVQVEDAALIMKCLSLPLFVEVKRGPKRAKNKS